MDKEQKFQYQVLISMIIPIMMTMIMMMMMMMMMMITDDDDVEVEEEEVRDEEDWGEGGGLRRTEEEVEDGKTMIIMIADLEPQKFLHKKTRINLGVWETAHLPLR